MNRMLSEMNRVLFPTFSASGPRRRVGDMAMLPVLCVSQPAIAGRPRIETCLLMEIKS
ncbi:hypothetical protein [Methylopila turkensis]|uniref:hypothetical protein n=1 Tax=Methylopila turkensis TaxID=1437816 RepID=UPI0022F33DD2|nr:hypothetical protein [Methylopila turkensis]